MNYIKTPSQYIKEDYMKSDAIGYKIGKYIYHVTTSNNVDNIYKNGFEPKDGISINGEKFENRLYFATSLISAYDLSVNFSSYKSDEEYVIFKINSNYIDDDYEEDPLFQHGIYIDYKIPSKYIVNIIKADDLFDKFDDNDIEDLYL